MAYRTKVALCLAVLIVPLLAKEFMPELCALGWHIGHGRTVRLKNWERQTYELEAPLLYWPRVNEINWDATLIRTSGPVRARLGQSDWAMMSFSVAHQYQTAEELRREASTLNDKAGLVLSEKATVAVAGQELYCFEQKWEKGRIAELSRSLPMVEIMCVPLSDKKSFNASYTGTRNYVPTVYTMLGSIKRVN